jgi:hypothetical protein
MDGAEGPTTKLIRVDQGVLVDIDSWWQARTKDGIYEQTDFCAGMSWRQRRGWTGRLMLLVQECKRLESILAKRKARAEQ